MLRTSTATAAAYLLSAMTPLLAQTTPPAGGAAGTAGTAGTAATSALADWWWVILLVVVIGAAIWYFNSRKGRV